MTCKWASRNDQWQQRQITPWCRWAGQGSGSCWCCYIDDETRRKRAELVAFPRGLTSLHGTWRAIRNGRWNFDSTLGLLCRPVIFNQRRHQTVRCSRTNSVDENFSFNNFAANFPSRPMRVPSCPPLIRQ